MTQEEKRIAIAKACGVTPVLESWWAYSDAKKSICLEAETKQEVENWLASLPAGSWVLEDGYYPKPFYRYPRYFEDLNVCAEIRKAIPIEKEFEFFVHLFNEIGEDWEAEAHFVSMPLKSLSAITSATPEQLCEAFGLALGLWPARSDSKL